MAPEKLELIFEPFVQGDTSTTRRYGGTGLGLAISGQLVALMGGKCGVSSQLNVGSRFWFTLVVHADAIKTSNELATPDPGLAGVTALVVDDNATQRRALSAYLTGWGMTVSTADSGMAALAMLRVAATQVRPFAVALVDRAMPGMDGLELTKAIIADAALAARVILMTELDQEGWRFDGGESGLCPSLSKPARRRDLRACLRVVMGLSASDVIGTGMVGPPPLIASGHNPARLLLAEDDLINQKVTVAILSRAGYQVDTVLDGAAAVQAAATQHYDAILMDCQMPALNGYEATAAIRAREGTHGRTPIIAMTAGARREDQERCLEAGMDSYLAKPVSMDALLDLVARSVATSLS